MTRVAGCDPASGKMAVILDDEPVTGHRWKATSKKYVEHNTLEAYGWVIEEFRDEEPGDLFLEAPVIGVGGARPTIVQSFTSGALQAAFLSLGWEISLVNVQRWKKLVVGSGRATKEDVARSLEELWPEGFRAADGDADLIDAAAICYYGRRFH